MTQHIETPKLDSGLPEQIVTELAEYEGQIKKYRDGELGEVKMQKARLQFGTYAQRQEGVQMQRIKIPGGLLSADQLICLADAADRYGSGFIHFTTREDAQLYYVKLTEVPDLLRFLAEAGITTREACGNTVRNITACYRAGTSPTESFNVSPYAYALFRYLVRNNYNQVLGRKFKITFEGCQEDHSGLRIHDIGFLAVTRNGNGVTRRGFRVYLGGGLGGAPHLGRLYSEFLPEEEIFNLAAAILRLFDRYGERKARMKARMKFLIETMGWETFRAKLDEERQHVGPLPALDEFLEAPREPALPSSNAIADFRVLDPRVESPEFRQWYRDSVVEHRIPGLRGVHVRLKLGDIIADRARGLGEVARRYSAGELRTGAAQNLYLPWVREKDLAELYLELKGLDLAEAGTETASDVTTCPGADTCRLGIASAKGLGSALSDALNGSLAQYAELARSVKIKVSGCPNGCAHHSVANIGFQSAAQAQDGRTVPAYMLFLGGKANLDDTQFGKIVGRFPAKNGVKILELLLSLFQKERSESEDFNSFIARIGEFRLKKLLEPLKAVSSFEEDPSLYQDWGHENERFAVRQGVKGECAGSTVAESVPAMETAWEWLAQGEAYFYHKEYEHSLLALYEAAASAARVPLYRRLVDPFTSEQALWEFENIFVLSGETDSAWTDVSACFERLKQQQASEVAAQEILDKTRAFLEFCATFSGENEKILAASSATG